MVPSDDDGDSLTFIDLFSGCGGFSLGLEWAGLACMAALDMDQSAIETFRANHRSEIHTVVADLTKYHPSELADLLWSSDSVANTNRAIDLVVGGPPCQGFSRARKVDGTNRGERLVEDSRRELFRDLLKFVKYFTPKMFVMENVPDIKLAAGGKFFTQVQAESRDLGYRVIPYEVEAWRFGVPQKRIRQFIIGTRRELPLFVPDRHIRRTHAPLNGPISDKLEPAVTLGEAIGDLPVIHAGDDQFERNYDLALRSRHLGLYGDRFTIGILRADKAGKLTGHTARQHSQRDLRDFFRLREGETSRQALARGVEMEFPYDRSHFKDRYTRQHRAALCSTIVAHLKKDGLMFIHPTQLRSLTPREAARIQTFPDTFLLPRTQGTAFAQIGNAVPPLVAKAFGLAIKGFLAASASEERARIAWSFSGVLPSGRGAAIRQLEEFVQSSIWLLRDISTLPKEKFLKAWWAVGYLHPHLHPDAAQENDRELSPGPRRGISFVVEPFYRRSGWPVELIPVAREARRRFEHGSLTEDEYYCSAAMMAGSLVITEDNVIH